MKKLSLAMCAMLVGPAVVQAAVTNLTAQADVDIRSTAASADIGYDRNVLIVCNKNVDPTVGQDAKAYIRFQLPADFGAATSATFTFTRAILGSLGWTYNVYGLNQGPIPGSSWDELTWPELNTGTPTTATTWNNAPGNDVTSGTNVTSASFLGTFTTVNAANGGVAGDHFSLSGTNLLNFLNADTNGFVTLIVTRSGVSSALDQWASKENGTYPGPMLTIEYSPSTNLPARLASQPFPAKQTIYATMNATFSASASGTLPISYQWYYNGTPLADGAAVSGANSNILTLQNVAPEAAGNYSLLVSNSFGQQLGSNAVLAVNPDTIFFNTTRMTNIWNLRPGQRSYLNTINTERGIAYNPFTTNLYVVSSVSNTVTALVAVLDARTGADKYSLNTSGVFTGVGTSSLALNQIGVGDDGAVYGVSQVINATNYAFYIYRWLDDEESTSPGLIFFGDPAAGVAPGLRWGDNFAVRGAGADTQILMAPGSGTNVVLLRTSSGSDFQFEVPPAVIAISGLTDTNLASGFGMRGVAFGPGTNTFWAKNYSNDLYLVQFDVDSRTGAVVQAYAPGQLSKAVGLSVGASQQLLATVALDPAGQNVQVYSISNLAAGPSLVDQSFYLDQNPNDPAIGGGWASTALGSNYLFALDANNGIKAFMINTNWTPLAPYSISGIAANNGQAVITSAAAAGHGYQLQSTPSLTPAVWSNVGRPTTATSDLLSMTNMISTTNMFYRLQGF